MTEPELRCRLAHNLTEYRRLNGMTQAEVAERLNYSDKSVSKWERGEGMPDVYVLLQIAELFGVSANDLLGDEQPRLPDMPFSLQRRRRWRLITLLSVGLVWLVAVVCFFFLGLFVPEFTAGWLVFVLALPPSFIVLVVFTCLWGNVWQRAIASSGLLWSVALAIHLTLPLANVYRIYIVAAVLQILVAGWFFLRSNSKKKG